MVHPGGATTASSYPTEAAARAVVRAARRELAGQEFTVGRALGAFVKHLDGAGLKAVTSATIAYRVGKLLAGEEDTPLRALTAARVQALYDAMRSAPRTSVQTHRHALSEAKRFMRWCVERRYISRSPAEEVKPVGKPKRGKPQLRLSEARKLVDTCVDQFARGDAAALAVLVALLLGLRASEIAALEVRDIDDQGALLWVADGKTEASRRVLSVPDPLRSLLGAYAQDRIGRLFPDRDRFWVAYHTDRLCRLAGVPSVPPHGLRGTHATLATEGGATGELVMRALGHTSTEVARRHYLAAGAAEDAQAARAAARITGSAEEAADVGNETSS